MDEENKIQEEQAMRLREGRMRSGPPRGAESAPAQSKISPADGLMIVFGLAMDLLSSIPFLGFIFDLVAGGTIWFWVKTRGFDRGQPWFISWSPWLGSGLESALNLVAPPLAALLPTFTLSVIMILISQSRAGRRFGRLIAP